MKYSFFVLLLVLCAACQTTKIKNETYKVSNATPELGSIGQSKSMFNTQNDFKIKTLPVLENNIRVAIEVVPFNKKINNIYKEKGKFNQKQSNIAYVDSLPVKPELTTIRIIDVLGFIAQLNAPQNTRIFSYLTDSQDSEIVTSIAVCLSDDEITKIRSADTYYLTNSQDLKYTISLYKQGKKTESMHIIPQTILAYKLSTICWGINAEGQPYIADLVEDGTACKGNTSVKINKKEKDKSLYEM